MFVFIFHLRFGLVANFRFPPPVHHTKQIFSQRNSTKEYDPNPLQSLGKRKQRTNTDHHDEPSTSASCFNFQYDTVSQSQLQNDEEAHK